MADEDNEATDVLEGTKSSDILEDVNKLRKSWEIEDHWILRRDFLLIHKNRFSSERLLCLAQMFVNVETLGNGYSPEMMDLLKDLTDDIPSLEEFRKRKADLEAGKTFQAPKRKKISNYGNNYDNRGGYGGGNYRGGGGYNNNRGGNNQGGYNQGYYGNRGGRGQGWSNSNRGRQY